MNAIPTPRTAHTDVRRNFLAILAAVLVLAPSPSQAAGQRVDPNDPDGTPQGYSYTRILYDNFTAPGGYTLSDYFGKWTNLYGPGEMGIQDTRSFTGGRFSIDAVPFQTSADFSVYDHIKYLGVSNQAFTVPEDGSVEFSVQIEAETPGTQPGRVIHGVYTLSGAPYAAATLEGHQAGATLHMIDFNTGQLFDWFVSGSTAFTLIERLPSVITGSLDFVGLEKMYTQIIDEVPLHPGPHTVSIRYARDAEGDRVEYVLDGRVVSAVTNVGVPLDVQGVDYTGIYPSLGHGEPVRSQIGAVAIGHGLFSLLDAFPFQHPDAPELSVSIPIANRIFGQGARAKFDNVTVTIGDRVKKPVNEYTVATEFSSVPVPELRAPGDGSGSQAHAEVAVDRVEFASVSPNPASGPVQMNFALPQSAKVSLRLFDMQGRSVATVVEGVFGAGRHQAPWDGNISGAPAKAGLYYARLEVGGRSYVKRLAVVH